MSKWFEKQRYSRQAKLRVFLFPYAGGGPSVFRGWHTHLDESIDIFAVYAPGREKRFAEPAISCLKEKTRVLHNEIRQFLDIPHVFIGHSNGAIEALELARLAARSGNKNLLHVIVSARRAPHLPSLKPPVYKLPYHDFVADLRENSTIPEVILNDADMLDMFIPMLRADFALGVNYDFNDSARLNCNASFFWGTDDDNTPKDDVMAWTQYFEGNVDSRAFSGGHFFINSNMHQYINAVRHILERY